MKLQLKNDLILRAARGEKVERVPVWLMRQAGRILPEYRAVRNSLSGFKELVETPELACEVTLQPVDILGVDAAIIFSDILVVPEAMGVTYQMKKGVGPIFETTVRTERDAESLIIPDPHDKLRYVSDAISLTKKELDGRVPLIGFAGAPWTIFSYIVEGGGSKTFSNARKILYQNPTLAHSVLNKITQTTITYLKAQIEAGADMVQVFDSWAGILPKKQYEEFALPYIKEICDSIDTVPKTVFSKGAYRSISEIAKLNCNTVGLDWNMDRKEGRQLVGNERTLQGNLDPCTLYAPDEVLVKETQQMLEDFGSQRYIANLGHGVYPDTNPEKVKLFIETVKKHQF
ncbi:uroporphyrinogen decarboxylase [Salibacter halophilus]|uniref:Uroporphyrinogen decarboxylase n=1 Tax=Salibacter halophilus TaxID=1803916 RepID=A0A6N6MAG1_9FLAO|nr:uroporphyrinogen decarboxylase [Salibacter halophilus]KAB1066161.1 uroporphyrinogen decarboxylase [Salibacter halophilus]